MGGLLSAPLLPPAPSPTAGRGGGAGDGAWIGIHQWYPERGCGGHGAIRIEGRSIGISRWGQPWSRQGVRAIGAEVVDGCQCCAPTSLGPLLPQGTGRPVKNPHSHVLYM